MEYQGWLARWGNGKKGFWNIDKVFSSASCAETTVLLFTCLFEMYSMKFKSKKYLGNSSVLVPGHFALENI